MVRGRSYLAHRVGILWAALAMGGLALLCLAPRASAADLEFCSTGSEAGQCAAPIGINSLRGLAIDYETGRLYVADKGNNRVEVFEEDGDFLFAFGWGVDTGAAALQTCTTASGCQAGIAGAGPGQLSKPVRLAVDNDPASPSHHAIYVVDEVSSRVQKFSPTGAFVWTVGEEGETEGKFTPPLSVGVGPAGVVYVLDNLPVGGGGVKFKHRLQRFKPSGEPIPPQCILLEGGLANALAVEASGSFWVANQGEKEAIRKYSSACTQLLEEDKGVETNELALDEAGDLFATQSEGRDKAIGSFRVVTAYKSSGGYLRRFAYGKIPPGFKAEGLAVHSGGEGGVFLALREVGIRRLTFPPPTSTLPPPGPIVAPPSVEASAAKVGSTKATLVAEINPEGKATQVHFEYLSQEAFENQGNSFSGPATKSSTTESLGAEGFKLKAFEAQIGCLNPASEAGEPGKCLAPETTYRFQVVATNTGGGGEGTVEGPAFKTKPSPEFGDTYATDVGTDTARLHAEVNPLSVPATGWFEYVADEQFQEDADEGGDGFAAATKVPGVDAGQTPLNFGGGEAFVSRAASVFPLAPGTTYHYRIVADNPLIEPIAGEAHVLRTFAPAAVEPCAENEASRIGPGALLPDCRAYEMVSPLDKAGGDIRVLSADLGRRAVLEQSADSGEKLAYGSVRSFGDAASAPFTSQYIAQRLAGREWETHSVNPPRGRPLFGAVGQSDTEFKAFSTDLCQGWLATFAEPPLPLSEGEVTEYSNLYRRSDRLCGAERFEALAPRVVPQGVSAGAAFLIELQGISGNGTHAIFTANGKLVEEGAEKQRQLYESVDGAAPRLVCILSGGEAVSGPCAAGSTVAGTPGARTGMISNDGERIFWSAGSGEGKLYVRIAGTQTIEVSKAAEEAAGTSASWFWGAASNGSKAIFTTGNLNGKAKLYSFDVDTKATQLFAEGVRGVMGVSADAGRVYFASDKALAAGASEGKANLYLYEAGDESTSFIATLAGADLTAAVSSEPYFKRSSRVSPDGGHAAFASVAPLTGYDNKGAESGAAMKEIYRYDAGTKKLTCVSCSPSGARPAGPATIPSLATSMHAARVLSDDGSRLYFESSDRLVARDSNGRVDVYQWEEAGAGGCDEEDADFAASAEGCMELVSSGQSPQDSHFVEASPTGHDVFFATVASLLPQDYGLFDIYDARVGGGLPIPPPPAPPCEGDACHAQAATPEEPTPASSSYVGPPAAPSAGSRKGRCAKGERRVGKKGKSRCVPKRKKQRHHGRAAR
jgi:NHL repeat-containing protein